MCMSICLHAHMCGTCMPDAHRGQKRASYTLELELQVVITHNMDAED